MLTGVADITFSDLDLSKPADKALFEVANRTAQARLELRAAAGELIRELTPIAAGEDIEVLALVPTLGYHPATRHYDEARVTIRALRELLSHAAKNRRVHEG